MMRFSVQSYRVLTDRLDGMLRALESKSKPTDQQEQAMRNLREQIIEYTAKIYILGRSSDLFIKKVG